MAESQRVRDPTRKEILAACKVIRASWTETERHQRLGQTLGEIKERPHNLRVIPTSDLPDWAKDLIYREEWQ